MAKRILKSKISTSNRVIVPELTTKDLDVKYVGGEPLVDEQPSDASRQEFLIKSLNWYSRFFDKKVAKEQLIAYCDYNNNEEDAKKLKSVDEKYVFQSVAWLARLYMRGLDLTASEKDKIINEISKLSAMKEKEKKSKPSEEKAQPKVNIQEVMKDKLREVAGELEGKLDDFINDGAKATNININSISLLSEKNILPQHVSIINAVWKKKQLEFQDVMDGKDKQLNEAYAHYGKNKLKGVLKFIETVLSGFASYVNVKKTARSPRKRKPVSLEKQVSKVKFCKTFEDVVNKLNLVSIHPAKILNSQEVWAYDTAKRKLHYYVADEHVGSLGIKGSTILGFDSSKSGVKTIRKPSELLKKLMAAGKPASRKMFTEINSVHAQPNGRTNENLLFLKVY